MSRRIRTGKLGPTFVDSDAGRWAVLTEARGDGWVTTVYDPTGVDREWWPWRTWQGAKNGHSAITGLVAEWAEGVSC